MELNMNQIKLQNEEKKLNKNLIKAIIKKQDL